MVLQKVGYTLAADWRLPLSAGEKVGRRVSPVKQDLNRDTPDQPWVPSGIRAPASASTWAASLLPWCRAQLSVSLSHHCEEPVACAHV